MQLATESDYWMYLEVLPIDIRLQKVFLKYTEPEGFGFELKAVLCCWEWKCTSHFVSNPHWGCLWMTYRALFKKSNADSAAKSTILPSPCNALFVPIFQGKKTLIPVFRWLLGYPHGPTEAEKSLCCAGPRTGLNSCNNATTLDIRCVSSWILERFSPEESPVIVNCSLIMETNLQWWLCWRSRDNLRGRI